jgi:hypothetical protein
MIAFIKDHIVYEHPARKRAIARMQKSPDTRRRASERLQNTNAVARARALDWQEIEVKPVTKRAEEVRSKDQGQISVQ